MKKVLISVPDDLLARIDRESKAQGTTRSGFLEDAARRALGWPGVDEMDAALARGRGALAGAEAFESADLVRRDREARSAADRRRM